MDNLNPEQVRRISDYAFRDPAPYWLVRALADSWLAQGEALAAAQQENQKLRGVLKEVSECCSCGYDLAALASLSNSPTEE